VQLLTVAVLSIQSVVIDGSRDPVLPFLTRKLRFSYWTGGSFLEKTIEFAPAAVVSAYKFKPQDTSPPLTCRDSPSIPQGEKEGGPSGRCLSAKNLSTIPLAASNLATSRMHDVQVIPTMRSSRKVLLKRTDTAVVSSTFWAQVCQSGRSRGWTFVRITASRSRGTRDCNRKKQ
jgi:hypothetical protein